MKARFIRESGTRATLRVYWGDACGRRGYHNAAVLLARSDRPRDWELGGKPEDYPDERWPTMCDACGSVVPPDATRQVFTKRLYDTASGDPEPGDIYVADWYRCAEGGRCIHGWTNCDGRHIWVRLPGRQAQDLMWRASNCGSKEDREHRCWIVHGEPPNITVDTQRLLVISA